MKIRNKKTGKIINAYPVIRICDGVTDICFNSLARLNEEFEDYTGEKPLIKDEKIRKAVRAWADANSILGDDRVEATTPTVDCAILTLTFGMINIDIFIDETITLENHGRYTIAELCGEEEE